jgi:hypothetical protein
MSVPVLGSSFVRPQASSFSSGTPSFRSAISRQAQRSFVKS